MRRGTAPNTSSSTPGISRCSCANAKRMQRSARSSNAAFPSRELVRVRGMDELVVLLHDAILDFERPPVRAGLHLVDLDLAGLHRRRSIAQAAQEVLRLLLVVVGRADERVE